MTELNLGSAERLAEEAERIASRTTEPPWHANDIAGTWLLQTGELYESMALDGRSDTDDENEPANVSSEQGRLNMEFCVYARTAVPLLASTLRQMVARVRELEGEASERDRLVQNLPRTADNVAVVIGIKVCCPNGHEHLVGPSNSMSGRIYCCQGECWSAGCQGDSGGGTHYRASECVAVPTK